MAKIKNEAVQAAIGGAALNTGITTKQKRGRPPKAAGDTIFKRITINCNKEEYELIEAKAAALGELTPGIEFNPTMLTKIAVIQYSKNTK